MGLKDAAKTLMEKAKVPIVPGYHGEGQEPGFLAAKAGEIGYPVLIKARAGGGGKGMRRVEAPTDFQAALTACRSEAKSAFDDDHVLIEKYVPAPRHIEIQIFGDHHGNIVHLFERDCSLQRRHQKVIEEAPAPGLKSAMRKAMCNAAINAARAVDYVGAGTVEFIVDGSQELSPDKFWFMEMNTRLQVEHPVTEMVTGIDLVEWQLRIASGEKLLLLQKNIKLDGHSVEARIYAENPARGFLPATGKLYHLKFPSGIRVDSGVSQDDEITAAYDPMIAKMIAHKPGREAAISVLRENLQQIQIAGATTNVNFLARLCANERFISGKVETGLIEDCLSELTASSPPPDNVQIAAALISYWQDKQKASSLGFKS